MMQWDVISECLNYGIDVGSHTHNHKNLAAIDAQGLEFELSHSRQLIRKQLGAESGNFIAYPNGQYNDEVLEATAKAGYSFGFTTEARKTKKDDVPLALPRISLYHQEWWKNYVRMQMMRW